MDGVYWIGQDGNYYIKTATSGGVQNLGYAGATNPNINVINSLQRINDPAGGNTTAVGQDSATAVTAPTGSTAPSGSTSTTKPLNQAAVNNTQLTIDQLPALLQNALAEEAQKYQNNEAKFTQQQQDQQHQYDTNTTTNQQNYDSNFMDSIRAGIHGLGGLMALLRGTGAAGGTADKQVQDVVGGITSNDIRGGADTQKENQGQLDTSLGSFLTDLTGKRKDNKDAYGNNRAAIQRDNETQLQDLYGKMAGFYGDAGNTGAANDWMNKAGALTPQIAQDTMTHTSPYDTTPIVVHAPNLTAFAPPSQPEVATAPSNGQVGTGIFTMTNTRRKDPTATPALAGA